MISKFWGWTIKVKKSKQHGKDFNILDFMHFFFVFLLRIIFGDL